MFHFPYPGARGSMRHLGKVVDGRRWFRCPIHRAGAFVRLKLARRLHEAAILFSVVNFGDRFGFSRWHRVPIFDTRVATAAPSDLAESGSAASQPDAYFFISHLLPGP